MQSQESSSFQIEEESKEDEERLMHEIMTGVKKAPRRKFTIKLMLCQAMNKLMLFAKKRGTFSEHHPLLGDFDYKEIIYPALLDLFNRQIVEIFNQFRMQQNVYDTAQELKDQCSLVCNLMELLKIFRDVGDSSNLEREIVFRSNYLVILYSYIEAEYEGFRYNLTVRALDKIKSDESILSLFLSILKQRIFIMDDLEFMGQKAVLKSAFLTIDQIKNISEIFNHIGYTVFQNE